jgi:NAD(P)-dependent dehydrogenase (short-subunit alcohol dehydrogenase family)
VDIQGKSVIVTGGARGIGLASARMLLERGARVTIGASSESSISQAVAQLGEHEQLASIASDVATVEGCEAVAQAAREAFGGIDALFTNAGLYAEAEVRETDETLWDTVIDTNLKSAFFCIQAALPELQRVHGVIVTMGSFNGVTGIPGNVSAYGAAKAGVENLTRALALDLAPDVRVNCIAPGFVETEKLLARDDAQELIDIYSEITPLGRIARREEIAHALIFAIENDFLNGATINIDGGRCAGAKH